VEWGGSGAVFKDVLGREYLDFLGGYGMMDLGWSHPEVVNTVKAQLERSPMPSQELLDPLRGVLGKLLASITPGDLKYSWFGASGTEANEAAMKIAKLYTGKSAFIVGVKAFHGKTIIVCRWARCMADRSITFRLVMPMLLKSSLRFARKWALALRQ
jgi:putrescine aminotransferase